MSAPEIPGYLRMEEGPHTYYVRPDWPSSLLEGLKSDFQAVPHEARKLYHDGRVEHFSYLPQEASGRVVVRRATRASIASALGDVHIGIQRFLQDIRFCEAAGKCGINVPEIVGGRLTRVGPGLYRFLHVMTEIPDADNLYRFTRNASPTERRRIIRPLARAVRRMHESGVYHGDLTLRNILLSGADNGAHIHFIDFDQGRVEPFRRHTFDKDNLRRLNRFVEKWLVPKKQITRTDKYCFLLEYASSREEARQLARQIGRDLWRHRLWWGVSGLRR